MSYPLAPQPVTDPTRTLSIVNDPLDCLPHLHMLKYMHNHSEALYRVFQALADPTPNLVERLIRGPASGSDLARPHAMSLPAMVRHLGVLEASSVVRSEQVGRVLTCRIDPLTLRIAEERVTARRATGERGLDQLGAYLAEQPEEPRARRHHGRGACHDRPLRRPFHIRPRAHTPSGCSRRGPTPPSRHAGSPHGPARTRLLRRRPRGEPGHDQKRTGPDLRALYHDIVVAQRLVYASTLFMEKNVVTASLRQLS
jgi:DNA-binding transcriptional ArsR family regulator